MEGVSLSRASNGAQGEGADGSRVVRRMESTGVTVLVGFRVAHQQMSKQGGQGSRSAGGAATSIVAACREEAFTRVTAGGLAVAAGHAQMLLAQPWVAQPVGQLQQAAQPLALLFLSPAAPRLLLLPLLPCSSAASGCGALQRGADGRPQPRMQPRRTSCAADQDKRAAGRRASVGKVQTDEQERGETSRRLGGQGEG